MADVDAPAWIDVPVDGGVNRLRATARIGQMVHDHHQFIVQHKHPPPMDDRRSNACDSILTIC